MTPRSAAFDLIYSAVAAGLSYAIYHLTQSVLSASAVLVGLTVIFVGFHFIRGRGTASKD